MDTSVFGLSASEIKQLAQLFSHTPTKQLGQNYLTNVTIVQEMIDSLDLTAEDSVVEVGGGLGALTLPLAAIVKKLVVIEKDPLMVQVLEHRLKEHNLSNNVTIHAADILQVSSDLVQGNKIISSVPYSITSPMLHRIIIEWGNQFQTGVFLIQKEMQEKITSKPPEGSYWYHLMHEYFDVSVINRVVKPASFWPAPGVDSSIIKIMKIKDVADASLWSNFLHQVFSAPRKQIKNAIPVSALNAASINPQTRAGAITKQEMERLFVAFSEITTQ